MWAACTTVDLRLGLGVSHANPVESERIELREQLCPPNAMITVSGTVTPDIAETLRQIILKTTSS
jgi:hypothetical protein